MHDAGALAHVERRQVEAEGVDPAQQPLDVEEPGVHALVGPEARGHQRHIVAELPRVLVAVGAPLVGAAQALADLRKEHAVGHAVVPRRSDGARPRQQPHVLLDAGGELRGGRYPAGALRQPLREALAFVDIAAEDHLLLPCQRLADALGVHVGIAVHVAARPGAEAQDRRHVHRAGLRAVDFLERQRNLLVEGRDHPIEDLHQVEQDLLALVGDREPLARQLLGLPGDGELHADAAPDGAHLVRRQRRVEPFQQPVGDPLLLAQQRPAAGLGRVRGEHRLDRQRAHELERLGGREPTGLQLRDRSLDAPRLRLRAAVQILAAAADPVHPLREVHGHEPGGEGAQQLARERRRPIAHAGGELAPRLALAGPGADGRGAIELDQLEQLLTALLEQDLAHQRAERVHILAQRLVLGRKVDVGAVHGVRILAGCGAAGRSTSRLPRSRGRAPAFCSAS